ncbi:MAG TPA: GNAT family N-acetyltransferase [Arenibaculum sp.]|nr:GNAT family N-acetyltransferase [Arenibaculum sp.]
MTTATTVRAAVDDDAGALIRIIEAAYAEYPGCMLDVDAEEPELRAIASAYAEAGGFFWVAERERGPVGMVGCRPLSPSPSGDWELCKLYVDRTARGEGIGSMLVNLVAETAERAGGIGVQLWTDTRFTNAHRLYERLGFVRQPGTRSLGDLSRSVEYRYAMRF